jgi:hypothetical protein
MPPTRSNGPADCSIPLIEASPNPGCLYFNPKFLASFTRQLLRQRSARAG